MSQQDPNRPLRIFDKILHGGLGRGNLGILMSRHGTGKVAVMTTLAIDHAMNEHNSLHVAYGKPIDHVRAYDDEVLEEIMKAYDLNDRAELMTRVERHKQIYTYGSGQLDTKRLRNTLEFLSEHAQFRPQMVEIQGWPDFETITDDEIRAIKALAVEFDSEIWLSAHTHRGDEPGEAIPPYISRFDNHLSVIVGLEEEAEHVNIRFLKTHDFTPPEGIHLEFDPRTMLIRWH